MRFLILNTDYSEYLNWLYTVNPGLENESYAAQMVVRYGSLFGDADFYSWNLRLFGHEAKDVYANNDALQHAWAIENTLKLSEKSSAENSIRHILQQLRKYLSQTPLKRVKKVFQPLMKRLDSKPEWYYEILAAQIKEYKPDILLNQSMVAIEPEFIYTMKPYIGRVVGQHSATNIPNPENYKGYDLIISSYPPTIELFQHQGVRSCLHHLGFDERVLAVTTEVNRSIPVSFVGSLLAIHSSRTALLESVLNKHPQLSLWGPPISNDMKESKLARCYQGQAWGKDMFQALRASQITLNHHGNFGPYANNYRLYEATGMGALLITDWKDNLPELFEPGKEVIAYHSAEECADLVSYYNHNQKAREKIANAGKQRTLSDHNFHIRMAQLIQILQS